MRKLVIFLGLMIEVIVVIGFVSAQGCCFNPINGLCSENVEEDLCTPFGGEFSEKSCSSFEKCEEGCCVLGESTVFSTPRECELLADTTGFEYPANFQAISEEECTNLAGSKEVGACLYGGDYEKDCKIQTRNECSTTNFYPGISCTNPELNTKCRKTTNTICYNEDVYSQDSCGNPDTIYKDCDYNKGTICTKYQAGIDKKLPNGNYVCRDLNCIEGENTFRKNGESWCSETDPNKVGSEYFRKVCLNGQISIEPCAPFRNELCVQEGSENNLSGSAKCKINDWAGCLNAGNKTNECDLDNCKIWKKTENYESCFNALTNFDLCVPLIPGGSKFYNLDLSTSKTPSGGNTAEAICAAGNYEREFTFGKGKEGCSIAEVETYASARSSYDIIKSGYFPDNNIINTLDERCKAIGDCYGKFNWVDEPGINEKFNTSFSCKVEGNEVKCTLKYECKPWKAPNIDVDCEKCNQNGIPCSEYTCKSLGKKCDYYEKEGIGYCTRSTDNIAPIISCTKNGCPKQPLAPYTPIEFAIATNEASECKFNLNFAGIKYSEMKYDFDKTFSTEHKMILNIPGQTKLSLFNQEGPVVYSLLKEGKNSIYVRCLDAAGNGESDAAFIITFEVMKTPDGNSPVILDTNPKSGSKIAFNTTEKLVSFKINEPSECKWSFLDEDYDRMNNTMSCDTSISESSIILGYLCSASLTNILTRPNSETKFYIRCKDQPWLEGNEDDLYKRNTNTRSFEYSLKPSEKLEILKASPIGSIIKTTKNRSINIEISTIGGADSGKAECKWRLFNSKTSQNQSFKKLLNTNSQSHKQPITNPVEGLNSVEIICNDSSGNLANIKFDFTLFIDLTAPKIIRIFELASKLKIKTDEVASCYFSTDTKKSCLFDINNASALTGTDKDHLLDYEFDTIYFIKCKDNYDNYNVNCGVALKVY